MSVDVHSFDIPVPDQISALDEILDRTPAAAIRRVALLLKVSGEYEDGSRERAKARADEIIAARGLADRTEMVTVIGCEGASTPHGIAFVDREGETSGETERRLAIGLARAAPPDEAIFGDASYADYVAAVVRSAMEDAGLKPEEVVTAIVNVPQPTTGDKKIRGRRTRAAAALGVGLATGEISRSRITDAAIVADSELYTTRAQTFIGPTIRNVEVIVLGNRKHVGGEYIACATVTTDLLDMRPLKRVLKSTGLAIDADGELEGRGRIAATIVKAGTGPDGTVLGSPTTILTSVTPPEKHVRAALSGAIGATLQTTRVFSTADPVQQAPTGGLHICCIVRA